MNKVNILGALCACITLAISTTATNAATLDVKMFGEVTSVDASLTSEFSVSESVEFGFKLDTDDLADQFGTNTSVDATSFILYDRYYIFGGDYSGTSPGDETGLFYDQSLSHSPDTQGFIHEDHVMTSADVSGFSKSQIYLSFGLLSSTFSGAGDPTNIATISELLALDSADIGSYQGSALSFDAPSYKYVLFDINDISVATVPVPAAVWLFGSGLLGLIGFAKRNKG